MPLLRRRPRMTMNMHKKLYVAWDNELQELFNRCVERHGEYVAAAELRVSTRTLHDLRYGKSRKHSAAGSDGPRKFVELRTVERLADLMEDPLIEDREAQPIGEWSRRGLWEGGRGMSFGQVAHSGQAA